ncbi:hypothetical protein FA130_20375, partial [Pseudomonas aeruginosa]|nr:hypothetical protein [Pseudomonas aeruginosa]
TTGYHLRWPKKNSTHCPGWVDHYIGTLDEEGPASRESVEYYPSRDLAQQALDNGTWTQREY